MKEKHIFSLRHDSVQSVITVRMETICHTRDDIFITDERAMQSQQLLWNFSDFCVFFNLTFITTLHLFPRVWAESASAEAARKREQLWWVVFGCIRRQWAALERSFSGDRNREWGFSANALCEKATRHYWTHWLMSCFNDLFDWFCGNNCQLMKE